MDIMGTSFSKLDLEHSASQRMRNLNVTKNKSLEGSFTSNGQVPLIKKQGVVAILYSCSYLAMSKEGFTPFSERTMLDSVFNQDKTLPHNLVKLELANNSAKQSVETRG